MSDDLAAAGDDQLVELLSRFEQALSDSTDPGAIDESVVEQDPVLVERLRAAQRGLAALARVRRRWKPNGDASRLSQPSEVETSGDDVTAPHEQRTIGRFRIQYELGRGGLGVVFLAYDPKLRRQVALKVPRSESLGNREMRVRFLREAEAAARLSHPHAVGVYEVGEAGPVCFIAVEYCAGPTLRQWLNERDGGMSHSLAADWLAKLAAAVQHAHSRGVLHRDIKPSNVLLVPIQKDSADGRVAKSNGAGWTPKLADFGMAKLLGADGESSDQTRTGALIGTIRYMAPEQAEGRTREIDVRTDVYGLGTVLYEMLTGQPPVSGDSDADALRQVLLSDITPPSRIRPDVPRDLEAICLKCLAKDSQRRYATAQKLSDDLRRFLSGKPTEARPPSWLERVWMWSRRRPAAAAIVASLTLSLMVIAGVVVAYSARLSGALEETAFQRDRAKQEANDKARMLYSAEVRLAYDAWRNRNREQAVELLAHHIPQDGETDHREFAWHYLWQQSHPPSRTLKGHKGEVFAVDYSPDGRLLASASKDGTARVWDVAAGDVRFELAGHSTEVTSVAISPDGNRVATGSEDNTVRVWRVATGELIGVLSGHTDHVLCVSYSPDGNWIASGSRDTTVQIWDASSLELVATIESPDDVVRAARFSTNGKLFVADETGHLYRFKVPTGEHDAELSYVWEDFFCAALSHHMPLLAAAGQDEIVRVFQLTAGRIAPVRQLKGGHTEWIQGVAFSPRDNTLASAGKDGVVQLWAGGDAELKPRTLLCHVGRVWDVDFSPDGRWLATAGADHTIKITPVDRVGHFVDHYPIVPTELKCAAFAPDADELFVGCSDGRVLVWDPRRRAIKRAFPPLGGGISALACSPDGSQFVTIDFDGAAHVWRTDGSTHRLLARSEPHHRPCIVWSPVGHKIALTLGDRIAALIDAETGDERIRHESTSRIDWIDFSPDGRYLAIGGERIRVWSLPDEKIIRDLNGASSGAFTSSSELIVTARGHIAALWNVASGQRVRRFIDSTSVGISRLALSANGRTLALVDGENQNVHLWDVRTGQKLATFPVEATWVESVAFDPRSHGLIALASNDQRGGQMIQWRAAKITAIDELPQPDPRSADSELALELNRGDGTDWPQFVVTLTPNPTNAPFGLGQFRLSVAIENGHEPRDLASSVVRRTVRFGPARLIHKNARGANSLDVGDVDNDGDVDLVAALRGAGAIHWYTNDGTGEFSTPRSIDDQLANAEDVVLVDLNEDGWLDVGGLGQANGSIRIYTSHDQAARFLERSIAKADVPDTILVTDLDNDGRIDVAWSSNENDRIEYALRREDGEFTPKNKIPYYGGSSATLAAADFDADGDLDIVAASNRRGILSWFENGGDARFVREHVIANFNGPTGLADVGDLDGDRIIDIVVPVQNRDVLVACVNRGDGTFTRSEVPMSPGTRPIAVLITDIDGDGDSDLAVGSRRSQTLSVYLNDGRLRFRPLGRPVNVNGNAFSGLAAADFNGDAILDLAYAGFHSDEVGWHEGLGAAFEVAWPWHGTSAVVWQTNGFAFTCLSERESDVSSDIVHLRFETSSGLPLSTEELRQVVSRISVYADENRNGVAEPGAEPEVAEIDEPVLSNGTLRVRLPSINTLPEASPLSDRQPKAFRISQLMAGLNRWARSEGHVGAIPLVNDAALSNDVVFPVAAISTQVARLIDVSHDELCAVGAPPMAVAPTSDHLYARSSSSVDTWARSKGYTAGLLVDVLSDGGGVNTYRTLVFVDGDVDRRDFHIADLGYPAGYPALCRAVQREATSLGFAAGFPVSVTSSESIGCLLVREAAVTLGSISSDQLDSPTKPQEP